MNRRRLLALALSGALISFVLPAFAAEPMKVAFVYVGPVGDAGWTYAHDQARLALEKAMAGKVRTSYVESVPEGADAERVIRKLALNGNKIIWTTSFGYMNPTVKVAKAYPDVVFAHATGYTAAKNLSTYETRLYEGAYLNGVLAGKMSKSNLLGVVASFPIPEVIRNIDAFTLGAQSVNPAIKTRVIWVNTWYDPAKERQAAETLISEGVDVLSQSTDSPATLQVAQEKGVYAFGWNSDMAKFAPRAQLTAAMNDWSGYYIDTVTAVMAGTWKSSQVHGGLKEGMIKMAPLNPAVPPNVVKVFEDRKKALIAGTLTPFQGPVKDQSGAIRVAAGSELPLTKILSMDFYVQGVEGTIPK